MKLNIKKVKEMSNTDDKTIRKAGRRLSRRKIKMIQKCLTNHPCVYGYVAKGGNLTDIPKKDWLSFTPEARNALEEINKEFEGE